MLSLKIVLTVFFCSAVTSGAIRSLSKRGREADIEMPDDLATIGAVSGIIMFFSFMATGVYLIWWML